MLRPFIPEIISGGKHSSQTLMFPSILSGDDHDGVDTTLTLSTAASNLVVGDLQEGVVVDTSLSLSLIPPPPPPPPLPPTNTHKRKRGNEDGRRPPPCIEEFPGLMRALEGTVGAVFLYRKRLEGSDLNRMFVTRGERFMEALTEEENAAVGQGLGVVGLDEGGRSYKLGLKKWQSLKIMVIKCGWRKMVVANHAAKGHEVYIWGFRRHGKLGLAIVFKP